MRLRALVVAVCVLAGTTVAPAWACACGGYVPDAASGDSRARVNGENALVRFDGSTEQIHLSMAVTGRSKSAAWIMPVPSAAKVELGRDGLFRQLEQQTRPRTERRTTHRPSWKLPRVFAGADRDMAAPGGGAVDVREEMRLGPFQVARLGATDADVVTSWLRRHGYLVPAGLAASLRPYVDERWEIVAVRLVPATASADLTGATPPLRLTFASNRIVYPMRMSRAATTSQTVTVYVAAPYRVLPEESPDPAVQPELLYAGRVESYPDWLTEVTGPASYLTAYTATYREPGRIAADFRFGRAPSDEPFERVRVVTDNDPFWANVGIVVAAHLLLLAAAVLLARRLHGRPA